MTRRTTMAAVLAAAIAAGAGAVALAVLRDEGPTKLGQRSVPGSANIFGAGYSNAPWPGGGGGGTLPPVWRLPAGGTRVVTFKSVAGTITALLGGSAHHGAEGDRLGSTDGETWRGISGIVHRDNGMFLVGVFLTDSKPPLPAPPRLDFTGKERFDVLAPRIGQTFFVGDGKGRRYPVPEGATRLYAGFVDGWLYERFYQGLPGWYGNNSGSLEVAVELEAE